MKLTKQQEKAVMQVYEAYWNSYLKGDMKAMASFLDDDFKVIGSTDGEVFFNKKEAMRFYKATAGQIAGKAEFRNRSTKVQPIDGLILITVQIDFYIQIDGEWTFYSKGRLSSLLQKKGKDWKFIHQHGSLPDTRAEEGQQVASEKIAAENLQLRDAIKRRTVELEQKNRELEIETALEKVRFSALSMKEPAEMVEVCRIISDQLELLGIKDIRNVQTAIINEQKNTYFNYQYFTAYKKGIVEEAEYNKHPKARELAETIKKSAKAFFSQSFRGKSLIGFRHYRNKDDQFPDPLSNKATSIHFYFYSFGPGALGLSTYNTPLSKDDLKVLKRFRNVFELAYRRYNDIALAEAQAREAKIEAALEKVRAVAMSMNKPDDLLNVCEVLFKEFHKLGFDEIRNAMINIHNDDKKTFLNYDYSDEIGKSITPLFYNIHPVIEKQIKEIRSANDAFSETVFKGKDLESWKEFRKSRGEKDDPRIDNISALYYYFYSIGTGSIGISIFSSINEEKLELLKRFRNVFSLSYQRYSDIALAEAQAKEAQIELALERVRARTMAMQHSDELAETAYVLFQQFKEIDKEPKMITIGIMNENDGMIEFWVTDWGGGGSKVNQSHYGSIDEPTLLKKIYKAWKNGNKSIVVELAGKKLQDWVAYRVKISGIPDNNDYSISRGIVIAAFFSKGMLSLSTYESQTPETVQLLERFAGVFDGTYTRFLDLQKAEAQAREAQIEAALERVRSRTMGMQKSEELKEVIQVVYEQFVHLNIHIEHTGFVMDYKARDDYNIWIADPLGVPSQVTVPYFDSVYYNRFNEAKEKGENFFATNLSFEEKNKFYQKLFEYVPGLPEESKKFYFSCPGLAASTVLLENVCLYIENFSGIPYSDEENNTLMRFGKVFQQTYTRFLDLQKAEAQAREAQIETALERVRSRTMAMHESNELAETAAVLFKQLIDLGVAPNRSYIAIMKDESGDAEFWITDEDGSKVSSGFSANLNDNRTFQKMFTGWTEKKKSIAIDMQGKELEDYLKHLSKLNVPFKGGLTQKRRVQNIAYFSQGFIGIASPDLEPEESVNLLERFAAVFNLTYRRFLDLQKAEAQTREAQIELSLERVRARTMAMQSSNELVDTSTVLFHQLKILGIESIRTGVATMDDLNEAVEVWSTSGMSGNFEKKILGIVPANVHPMFTGIYNSWRNKEPYFAYELKGDELKKYYRTLSSYLSYPKQEKFNEREIIYTFFFPEGSLNVVSHNALTEDECALTIRFAKVFGLVYRRFLDLKLAEAQTREAKIEAALERVRAKAMSMHTSNDISETMGVVFSELPKLGIGSLRCGVALFSKGSRRVIFYAAANAQESDSLTLIGTGEMSGHPEFENQYECWLKQENYFVTLSDEALRSYYEALFARLSISYNPKEHKVKTEHGYYFPFSEGMFYAWAEEQYSENEINILNRFKVIFDLTFRRYLDLQKAEAQAREAKIEAALERVRSKAMSMHSPDDLSATVNVFFKELKTLGIIPIRCGVGQIDGATRTTSLTTTTSSQQGDSFQVIGKIKQTGHPVLDGIFEHWKLQKEYHPVLQGEDIKAYYNVMNAQIGYPDYPEGVTQYGNCFFFKEGFVFAWTEKLLSEEELWIFRRFTSVLSLTYRRYIDLKEAEAQAREAKIEAALERVRAKAMSMHSSEDLASTVDVFFKELKNLKVITRRCGVNLIDEDSRTADVTVTTATELGEDLKIAGKLKLTGHPVLENVFKNWKLQNEYHPVLRGSEINNYYEVMNPQIAFPDFPDDEIQYGYYFFFKDGGVFAWTDKELLEEDLKIFRRFTSVISLTYRRYMDLKEAEARAVEAVKQASLDRVRAEIASMRTSEDLNHITPIIWSELKALEVPFIRCGVYIIDEANAKVQVYLTTPDGKSLGVLNLSFDANKLTSNTVEYWKKKIVYSEHWTREQFISWTKSLIEQGQIPNAETYQGSINPPESLDLHFVPFTQGMLYVGDTSPLNEENIQLVKSLAEAFSIAYARYEDFQRLEAAKVEVESAFGELDILSNKLKVKNEELENENRRKALELEEARQLQLSMLPKELPKLPNLDIAVYMKTATEVGGDYYDFNVDADEILTVAIGDATGHGMKAGTIVSMIKALFASSGSGVDMKSFFNQSSDTLKGIELGRLMMAFLMLKIRSNKLEFVNAGMPPLFIYRKLSNAVEEIMLHGMPLGALKDFPYEIGEIKISSGDTILLLSDGLPELKNEKDEQYGYLRVKEVFNEAAEKSPNEIVEYLKNTAARWVEGIEPDDDVTFVVIRIK